MNLDSSVDTILSTLTRRDGLARTNRFEIYLDPPVDMNTDARDISILCESCSLPGKTISTLDYRLLRQSVKIANGYVVEDVTFSFHLTTDYHVKKVLDQWMDLVVDIPNYRATYLFEYRSTVSIYQLDQNNNKIYGIKLRNAYPISLTAITLDNSSTDSTQKISVTLTYEDYEVIDIIAREKPKVEQNMALNTMSLGSKPVNDIA